MQIKMPLLIEVVHDTDILESVAYLKVWEEDGDILNSFMAWKVENVPMPLDCMPTPLSEFFADVAADEYLGEYPE